MPFYQMYFLFMVNEALFFIIFSYLSNRKQISIYIATQSKTSRILLLLHLYMNALCKVSKLCFTIVFAKVSYVFLQGNSEMKHLLKRHYYYYRKLIKAKSVLVKRWDIMYIDKHFLICKLQYKFLIYSAAKLHTLVFVNFLRQ